MISAALSDPADIQEGAQPEQENGSEPIGTITTNMKTDSHCLLSIIMYVFIYEYSPFWMSHWACTVCTEDQVVNNLYTMQIMLSIGMDLNKNKLVLLCGSASRWNHHEKSRLQVLKKIL